MPSAFSIYGHKCMKGGVDFFHLTNLSSRSTYSRLETTVIVLGTHLWNQRLIKQIILFFVSCRLRNFVSTVLRKIKFCQI